MENNEKKFLESYDSSEFEKVSLTTDALIFSISNESQDNYRKTNKKHFTVLLVKREDYPFKDMWSLPGGFVDVNENLEDSVNRILKRETNLSNIYLEQLYTFGEVNRDPRMRIISTAYMSLIDKNKIGCSLTKQAKWFDISMNEEKNKIELYLKNGDEVLKVVLKRNKNGDLSVSKNNDIAFDHSLILYKGIERLKNKIEYTDIAFNLLPRYFTLSELQQVYELILNKKLLAPAFRRIIKDKVMSTGEYKTGEGHRPAALFKKV
ncbi:MAG: NUDIX domain-containing protein [Clostridia bacterium]|nr:NUDIX domain-containing protein [Clostridia bacterium]